MILADTSVWVDHFRSTNPQLRDVLIEERLLTHPMVVGELACGNLPARDETLFSLQQLPAALVAQDDEVLRFIEEKRLWGSGLGWIDAHLLASALLTGCHLWTLDRRLHIAARELRVSYPRP